MPSDGTTRELGIECDVDGCDDRVVGLDDGWEFSRGTVCRDCIDYHNRHGHWPDEDPVACRECVLDDGGEVHDCPDSTIDVLLRPGKSCPNCGYEVPIADGGEVVDGTEHKQVYECVACDDFELMKSYSGRGGTPAREEYDRISAPHICPVCGGRVDLVDEVVA